MPDKIPEIIRRESLAALPNNDESPCTFDVWQCPKCGVLVSENQFLSAAYNFDCARCHKAKFSEFRLLKSRKLSDEDDGQKEPVTL